MTERSWELTDLSRDTWDAESNRRDAREILELGPAKAQLNTEAFADQVRDMGIPLPHLPEYTRADHLAERGPPDPILPTDIPDSGLTCTRTDYGWPLPALGSTSKLWFEYSGDGPDGVPTSVEPISETHGVIELPWSFHAKRFKQLGMEPTTQIPIKPRPAGFTLNTAIFFAVWATLLVAPIALRRQIRRIRGQCKHCGYQTHSLPRCPECGSNA